MKRFLSRVNGIIIKIYNFTISTKLLNLHNQLCRKVRKTLFHNIGYECYVTFGRKNQDKKVYIIRCSNEKIGLFGLYNHVVHHLKKAEALDAYPVVDWQYYPNSGILDDDLVGKENAWEYFFEQPRGISLEDAYKSWNVIMSTGEVMGSWDEVWQEDELQHSHELIEKYIRLNQKNQKMLERKFVELNMHSSRVLGVLCRGTDFAASKPKGHAICPSAEETIKKIEEMENQWKHFDRIFLATEDDYIFAKMKKQFEDKMIFCQHHRIQNASDKWLNELYDSMDYRECKRKIMQEYLLSVYLLARCDALIAPVVGGTLGAMRIKGKYENVFLFQLGLY